MNNYYFQHLPLLLSEQTLTQALLPVLTSLLITGSSSQLIPLRDLIDPGLLLESVECR